MPHRMAYCSACDRPVPVELKPDAPVHVHPSVRDAEDLICLDYGVRCTGALCPLFSTPDDVGAVRAGPRQVGPERVPRSEARQRMGGVATAWAGDPPPHAPGRRRA